MTRILQITDIHLVAPPRLVSGRLSTFDIFKNAIDRILEDGEKIGKIDAIVATGDITDTGDVESFGVFKNQIERLGLPYYLVPGNHDLQAPMLSCFDDVLRLETRSKKINWVQDINEIRLIGLDTSLPNESGGILDEKTLAFLSESILTAQDKPILIALHHPPFQSGIQFMDKIGLKNSQDLDAILNDVPNEIRLISGHLHSTMISSIGNNIAISSAAISSSFLVDYRENAPIGFSTTSTGYMVHEWNNGFRSTCMPLSQVDGPHPF